MENKEVKTSSAMAVWAVVLIIIGILMVLGSVIFNNAIGDIGEKVSSSDPATVITQTKNMLVYLREIQWLESFLLIVGCTFTIIGTMLALHSRKK